jgi:tetratricopeptide (TPR) repeat protein
MGEMHDKPVDLDAAFRLLESFHPEAWPMALELLQDLFATDSESRHLGGELALSLQSSGVDGLSVGELYIDVSRAEARRYWRATLQGLEPQELHRALFRCSGRELWGLAEVIAFESRCVAKHTPPKALALATEATSLAQRVPLPQGVCDRTMQRQLEGLTLAYQANALRAADRIQDAREKFDCALSYFDSVDAFGYFSIVLSLRGSLEIFERDYFNALQTLQEALQSTRHPGERARIHLKRSMVYLFTDDLLQALEEILLVRTTLRDHDDPWLSYCVAQHQADLLSRLERFEEAQLLFPDLHRRLAGLQSDKENLQVRWVEARVAVGMKRPEEGEALFHSVREGFLALELPYRAAVVTVELAQHLYQEGRFQEVAKLAEESVREFHRQGVEPEVVAAVALLEDAHRGQLSKEIVGQILKQVQRAAQER